ncbi:glycoside hydrolase family 2 TIM barrel-domain containing protein, partial [Nostoc sp. 'Peltigera malacea cyanobiont' DB3992]|uniref:glycoside hydrolase family 2 protein n=1 Tax=Nostoc sp. 'Peltigera malacea cyanobiont' DB3992 TaxID=1206980 RepID=UPI00211F1E9E
MLKRSQWQTLNGQWKFAFDEQGMRRTEGFLGEWSHHIEVPFAPESIKSGIDDRGFHPNCWYEREFETPLGDGRLLLHFGAVDYRARVWVNDKYIAEHEGGHTPFSLDITHALNDSGTTKVTVWAQDDPHDLAKPRGKQDWQLKPHSIWYPRTSGIWQTVWLEHVGEAYIGHLRWIPDCERWEIGFEIGLAGNLPASGVQIKVKLSVGGLLLASDTYEVFNGEISRRIVLGDPGIDDCRNELLWSPEKPTLIDAEIQLLDKDHLLDEVQSYTAMRTVSIQRDRFMLNGRPYYLRLVLDQGYWPDTLMTPPSDEALRRDVELVKAMGFNGVRKHQIEDPRFLYWADVLGLLVWEEMPSAYRFTPKAVERMTREWTEIIKRDVSHPCIVAWVPFNESWGVPNLVETAAHRNYVLAMYHLTKTLDPTRPVIGNDGWESTDTDILAIHDYE